MTGGHHLQSALSRMRGLGQPNITMRLQTPGGRVLLSVVHTSPLPATCFQLPACMRLPDVSLAQQACCRLGPAHHICTHMPDYESVFWSTAIRTGHVHQQGSSAGTAVMLQSFLITNLLPC